ncbi:hypothetical protein OHB39_39500 [Streptomyces sp. NBC_00047]|uniref:hypothetical protein n=1 Tax=Streptomyces sp. NBC_00047 TaxID=2975627 RepID=UPI002251A3CE|nr:hypothetical protein [Streptomyces sp. NBC_00047]MCX5613527.1 hypothetical protein [Streptomyces sp. NBC_00047]
MIKKLQRAVPGLALSVLPLLATGGRPRRAGGPGGAMPIALLVKRYNETSSANAPDDILHWLTESSG